MVRSAMAFTLLPSAMAVEASFLDRYVVSCQCVRRLSQNLGNG